MRGTMSRRRTPGVYMELLKYVQVGSGNIGKEGGWKEVMCSRVRSRPAPPAPQLTGWGAGQSDGEVYARRVGLPWPLTSGLRG